MFRLQGATIGWLAILICAAPIVPQTKSQNLDVYRRCPMEGSAKTNCTREQNRLKNRWRKRPAAEDIDRRVTLTAMLEAGDDELRWSADRGAEITGFVVSVENTTGGESVNCGGNSAGANDFHINLVADPAIATSANYECQRVIVEITPRWQFLKGWTHAKLKAAMVGKWVSFRGWLFFDRTHLNESFNTRDSNSPRCGGTKGSFACGGPFNKRIWRATAWEIHPVTDFQVLPARPAGNNY